jgi:pyruvate formate lyase activating enzyme
MNSEQFKIQLGGDIEIVKSNLKSLDELGKELIVRVPLVPGFTDSFENIKQIVQETIKLKNIIRIEFLLFHQLGKHKYHSLDKIYTLESVKPVVLEQMEHVFNFLNEKSIRFKVIS